MLEPNLLGPACLEHASAPVIENDSLFNFVFM